MLSGLLLGNEIAIDANNLWCDGWWRRSHHAKYTVWLIKITLIIIYWNAKTNKSYNIFFILLLKTTSRRCISLLIYILFNLYKHTKMLAWDTWILCFYYNFCSTFSDSFNHGVWRTTETRPGHTDAIWRARPTRVYLSRQWLRLNRAKVLLFLLHWPAPARMVPSKPNGGYSHRMDRVLEVRWGYLNFN